ncbi:MAG TPA: hypothetical protein VMV72_13325 [Verrucomicrobiae bacterium]|nr:hypothetical protein [Verrucomicrobiae bacterium]
MSLVHEALRKAAREKQRKTGAAPAAPVQPLPASPAPSVPAHQPVASAVAPASQVTDSRSRASATEQRREASRFLLPALIGCVAIVAIIAIVFLASNALPLLRQAKDTAPVTTPAASAPAAASTAPATTPTASAQSTAAAPAPSTAPVVMADESLYKISGIMNDPDGKPVAVINGRVAYEGYYIDGATIEKIESDRVTLDIKGQKELLRLH